MNRLLKFMGIFMVFVLLVGILYMNSTWVGKWIYPIYYQQEIQESAAKYQVDPHLIAAIIRVESNYNPGSISEKGAIGIMQIMPNTAAWIMETKFKKGAELIDVQQVDINIEIGTYYLNWLKKYYQDNLVLVIAAYNAGQGNVDNWLKTGVWEGHSEAVEQIPIGETRLFVQRVLYYYQKYQQIYEIT